VILGRCHFCARLNAASIGMGSFLRALKGLVELGLALDEPSFRRLEEAAAKDFAWLRFENETLRLVIPATAACAKRIAADPKTAKWIREVESS
jgi:hypothetical protein